MDEPQLPTPGGYDFSLIDAGEAWSWRLTTPEGTALAGHAPNRASARRSAAIVAALAETLTRVRGRGL